MSKLHYRSIWISDTHLGAREAKSEWLLNFLTHTDSDHLYLVGDIIDMWQMKKGQWYWPDKNTQIIEAILDKSRQGTRVVYVPGNHDYGIRKYDMWRFGDIDIKRQVIHTCENGKRMLITHGDEFDALVMSNDWTTWFGNHAYDAILRMNCWLNELRERFGLGYWSLSAYIKSHIRKAQEYIERYEDTVIAAARQQQVDGVICGHIHHPNMRSIDNLQYVNTGDWVEHCTAVCENSAGELQLLNWPRDVHALVVESKPPKPDTTRLPEAA